MCRCCLNLLQNSHICWYGGNKHRINTFINNLMRKNFQNIAKMNDKDSLRYAAIRRKNTSLNFVRFKAAMRGPLCRWDRGVRKH